MIIGTLLVKDEEEIMEEWFEHHIASGIDKFIVTNNSSTDASRQIAEKYKQHIEFIIDEPAQGHLQNVWVTRMAHEAAKLNPDWIVHIDADEFWSGFESMSKIPKNIGLVISDGWINHFPHKDIKCGEFKRDQMPFHLFGTGSAPNYPVYTFQQHFANNRKIIHRPSSKIIVFPGNHRATNFDGGIMVNKNIKIHHYPIRYFEQFEKKVKRGGEAMLISNYPEYVNYHWRKWYKEYLDGNLYDVYQKIINNSKGRAML